MHKRTRHSVWNRYCRDRTVTSLRFLVVALAGTMLSGCLIEIPTPTMDMDAARGLDKLPRDETGPWTYRDPTEKELLLARSDFSMEIVRFTDSRLPRSMEVESPDQIIYNYDPDVLIGGVNYQVPGILGKYLSYRPKMPKHYKVEIELKRLVTNIESGTFWSGSWGRYHVAMEVQVIARRPDSTVGMMKTFRMDEHQPRDDYNGRGPSKERDRARMFDLVEGSIRKMAEDIGWNLRQRDARNWKAPQPEEIHQRLNLPPVDRASGTPDADEAVPKKLFGPVIVPGERVGTSETLQDYMPKDDEVEAPVSETLPEAPEDGTPVKDDYVPGVGDPEGPVI